MDVDYAARADADVKQLEDTLKNAKTWILSYAGHFDITLDEAYNRCVAEISIGAGPGLAGALHAVCCMALKELRAEDAKAYAESMPGAGTKGGADD